MSSDTRRSFLKVAGCCAGAALAVGLTPPTATAVPTPPTGTGLPDWASARFLSHWNCSQAVLEAFAPRYGMSPEAAQRVATAFAGGMGDGRACGAMTGAYMALGLAMGAEGPDPDTMAAAARLTAAMREEFGDMGCSALMGEDMSTPEGVEAAGAKGLFTTTCPRLVEAAVRLVQRELA